MPKQTEQILGAMERLHKSAGLEKVKPRHSSFNACLAAWSKSGRPEAVDRASAILSFMELLSANGDKTITPDSASYNAHTSRFSLDTILFNTAMGAWAKSNKSGAYRKARSILDRQISLCENVCESCKPDVFGCTSVIASCAAEPGDEEERFLAFRVAMKTYKDLHRSDDSPNHATHGTVLKACAKLLPSGPARRKEVKKIFRKCCEAGCVGEMVVSRLREAAPADVYKELMQGNNKRSLPKGWTRDVNEMNECRKRKTSPKRKHAEVQNFGRLLSFFRLCTCGWLNRANTSLNNLFVQDMQIRAFEVLRLSV